MKNQGESGTKLNLLSPALQTLARLVEEGKVEWRGGKPKRLRGVVVRGEPVSDTIIRSRR